MLKVVTQGSHTKFLTMVLSLSPPRLLTHTTKVSADSRIRERLFSHMADQGRVFPDV